MSASARSSARSRWASAASCLASSAAASVRSRSAFVSSRNLIEICFSRSAVRVSAAASSVFSSASRCCSAAAASARCASSRSRCSSSPSSAASFAARASTSVEREREALRARRARARAAPGSRPARREASCSRPSAASSSWRSASTSSKLGAPVVLAASSGGAAVATAGASGASGCSRRRLRVAALLQLRPEARAEALLGLVVGGRHQKIFMRLRMAGPEDDEEHRREDEEHRREEHLDRRLHRLLLGGRLTLQARSVACTRRMRPSEMPSWSAWMIARRERRDLGRRDALGQLLERVLARLADPHLAERERELLGERALHVLGQLRDGAVEAEAGLDARRRAGRARRAAARGSPRAARARHHDDEARGREAADSRGRTRAEDAVASRRAARAERRGREAAAERAGAPSRRGTSSATSCGPCRRPAAGARSLSSVDARVEPEREPRERAVGRHEHALAEAQPLEARCRRRGCGRRWRPAGPRGARSRAGWVTTSPTR